MNTEDNDEYPLFHKNSFVSFFLSFVSPPDFQVFDITDLLVPAEQGESTPRSTYWL
jgi:hypothetical protein